MISAFLFGFLGVAVGYITLSKLHIDWNIPSDLVDPNSFLAAGTMHTFGYIGAIILDFLIKKSVLRLTIVAHNLRKPK